MAGNGQFLFEPEIFLLQHRVGQTHSLGFGLGRVIAVAQGLAFPVQEGNIRNAQFLSQVLADLSLVTSSRTASALNSGV